MPDRKRLDKISGELSPQPNVPPTLAGERLGKDPQEIEAEYAAMIREDVIAAINQSYVVREQHGHGTPLEELDAKALIALALSYYPEDPPDAVIVAIGHSFDTLSSDPIMNEIDAGYYRELLIAGRGEHLRGATSPSDGLGG